MTIATLDCYLARGFIPFPAVWAALTAYGIDRERAEATWRRGVIGGQCPLGLCELARRVPGQPQGVCSLRLGYDTFSEVRSALGEASRSDGWWPWESWEYEEPDGSPIKHEAIEG